MKWEEVKTPKQLLKYMSENIKYGFVDHQGNIYSPKNQEYFQKMHREKWRLTSSERLRKVKYGECLDVVELERDWFLQNGYQVKTFYIWFEFSFANSYSIHTYLVYRENNKYYYFEYADALNQGIYSFYSLEELLKYQKQNHIESNKKRNPVGKEELKHIHIYEYEKPNYECTYSEFIDFILEKGSEILMSNYGKKELYEYKLDLLYHGISISKDCYDTLRKGVHNQINNDDYITTKGLMIVLDSKAYVSANLNEKSSYKIEIVKGTYILNYKNFTICNVDIIQPPDFALQRDKLSSGELITDFVNIHGDRIRIQPIDGCANKCRFCDLNKKKYKLHSINELDEAFQYALSNVGFRHVLISGGSPLNNNQDYEYLNNVYKFFGQKYGTKFPIDIMLVPRGLNIYSSTCLDYEEFLKKLKEWNISGLSVNLELYNEAYRKKIYSAKGFCWYRKLF